MSAVTYLLNLTIVFVINTNKLLYLVNVTKLFSVCSSTLVTSCVSVTQVLVSFLLWKVDVLVVSANFC